MTAGEVRQTARAPAQNALRARLRANRQAVGGWVVIPDMLSAETVAWCGFDYVGIDMQHGLVSYGDLPSMVGGVQLAGATPIVRVPFGDFAMVQRALDAGAHGIIFPLCESAATAAAAVASTRYAPRGARSFGPSRSRMYLGGDPASVNDEVLCFVMVETTLGLDHLEEIAATPDLDGIYVGPSDLAISLGISVGADDPRLTGAYAEIVSACRRFGIVPAIHAPTGDAAAAFLATGFAMATVSSDAVMLRTAYIKELQAARGTVPEGPAAGIYI